MAEGMTGATGGGDEDQSFVDFQDYLMLHARNGVILNGVLTWIDIQQRTTAPQVWRNQANAWFSEPEVIEAKEALWRVCEKKIDIIGKMVNRTSSDKKNVSIGDIGDAMAKLREKDALPLMLGSSLMLLRIPCYNTMSKDDADISTVVTRVNTLEDSMNEHMKQQAIQMTNLVNIVNKFSSSALAGSSSTPNLPPQRERLESLSKKHKLDDDMNEVFHQQQVQPVVLPPRHQPSQILQHQPAQDHVQQLPVLPPTSAPSFPSLPSEQSYAQVTQRPQYNWKNVQNQQFQQQNKRRSSTLLFGQSKVGKDNQTQLLAANVNLVAAGVSKGATDEQLKEFLEDKGVKVEEIECLTHHPDARTKAFRIAIAISDYEKALNPDVWPYRVAVRPFRPSRKDRDQKSLEYQFGRSGGVIQQHAQQQAHHAPAHHQQQAPRVHASQQQKQPLNATEVLEISNRYEVLAGMETNDN